MSEPTGVTVLYIEQYSEGVARQYGRDLNGNSWIRDRTDDPEWTGRWREGGAVADVVTGLAASVAALTQQLADCRRALVSYAAADESDDGWGAVSADDLEQAGEQLALARSGAQEAGK